MPKFIKVGMIHGSKVWLSSRILWTIASKFIYRHIVERNLYTETREIYLLLLNVLLLEIQYLIYKYWNFKRYILNVICLSLIFLKYKT